ncbi:MAG: hypothetical protein GXO77_04155 [Calditrichaeota bacterium]|nr:hypothetical protein [Calditrichota bacterium]
MLRSTYRNFIVAGFVLLFLLSFGFAQETRTPDWKKFSKQLVKSVKSENEGVRISAMQQIIRFSDSVKVTNARYAVMKNFLSAKDHGVRQLALITLYKIGNWFDMGYLQLHYPYEKDPLLKRQIAAILIAKGRRIPQTAAFDNPELQYSLK